MAHSIARWDRIAALCRPRTESAEPRGGISEAAAAGPHGPPIRADHCDGLQVMRFAQYEIRIHKMCLNFVLIEVFIFCCGVQYAFTTSTTTCNYIVAPVPFRAMGGMAA